MVSNLSLPSIDSGENPFDILLSQVLTPTDAKIIDVVARLRDDRGKTPTATNIQEELSKSNQLKKTQLYERLNRLTEMGFLSVRLLPRPRRYFVNQTTISQGVEKWVEEQCVFIASLSLELETIHNFLKHLNVTSFVSALTEKLSMDSRLT